jgi:hypothetical protein
MEEHGAEHEGAHGNQDGGRHDQDMNQRLVAFGSGEKRSSISARLASAPT